MASRPERRILALKHSFRSEAPPETNFWGDLSRRIRAGKVIPILGNSVFGDRIFSGADQTEPAPPLEALAPDEQRLTVDEQLAEVWADAIGYPLGARFELARVAQFNLVRSDDAEQAKSKYLSFLKRALLNLAELDGTDADTLEELKSQVHELGFADLAQELDYPRGAAPEHEPLRLLARLPLPIYLTTSYYDFLERALRAEGRAPRTQVCFWNGESGNVLPEHRPDPTYQPTPANPLVYHLHGLERYPRTLVLSEDDYLDFLVAVAEDTTQGQPVFPLYLRSALKESSLILLGYRLQDWDFRVVFRGIVKPWETSLRLFSVVIQLSPESQGGILNSQEARSYLQAYFEPSKFKVEWGDPVSFIRKLWSSWNEWRQGQG